MNTRMCWKKRLTRLCVGGVAFTGLFWGNSCTSNAALTTFYTGVGNGVIDTAADSAANAGGDFDAIVVQPTAVFLKNLWATFVGLRIPADPIFQNQLLVK